ncbi:MAG TPA: hypothetical protein PKL31_10710 [Fulvivirga sp.]|nr:hypothetical protein [Fulvivirga sp.]
MLKILFFFTLISLASCNLLGDGMQSPNTSQGKSDAINFNGILSTNSPDWQLSSSLQRNYFDKSKYQNIDSIIFQAGLRTPSADVKCQAQLYIIDDGKEVYGSELTSVVNYQLNQLNTGNLKFSLPDNNVLLGVRLRSSKAGVTVYSGDASYLKIYYH